MCFDCSTVQRQVESYLKKLITIKPKPSVAPEAKPHIQAAPPQAKPQPEQKTEPAKPKTTDSDNLKTEQIAQSATPPQEPNPNEKILAHALQAKKNDLKPTEVRTVL